MPWIVVDLVLVVIALVCLLLTGLTLWRAVKGLAKDVGAAGTTLGSLTDELARLQPGGPAAAPAAPAPRAGTSTAPGRRAQVGRQGSARVR